MTVAGAPAAPRHTATIAAELLYWTRLPPEAGRLDLQQLRYRFERVLPVPVEALHVVSARQRDGATLLAGIEPERLRAHLAQRQDLSADTWELLPDRVPGHLAGDSADAALPGLNLLQDAFEPERRRRARRLRDSVVGIGLALALVLGLVGVERRVSAQAKATESMRRTGQELLAQAMGQSGGALPSAAQMTQELRRLEQAAHGPAAAQLDITSLLQRLWAGWPAELRMQVDTISLTQDRLVIRGSVPSLADAEQIAKAYPTLSAGEAVFQAAPLQAEQTAHGAVVLLTWYLQGPGQKGGPP